uniref:Uncharacterized protein n=1 Tax=Rhizophora mucronata TaxID=61149 RepID=A0A2P2PS59_RHIMU
MTCCQFTHNCINCNQHLNTLVLDRLASFHGHLYGINMTASLIV